MTRAGARRLAGASLRRRGLPQPREVRIPQQLRQLVVVCLIEGVEPPVRRWGDDLLSELRPHAGAEAVADDVLPRSLCATANRCQAREEENQVAPLSGCRTGRSKRLCN